MSQCIARPRFSTCYLSASCIIIIAIVFIDNLRSYHGMWQHMPFSLLAFALQVSVVPPGEAFNCTPTHVWDGDGPVWCAEGPRLRIAGIAARELDGSCSPGHPCPDSDPKASRDALVSLLGRFTGVGPNGHVLVSGPTMRCASTGRAGGDRTGAWCVSPRSGDISCAMVEGGWAARWDKYWGRHRCS